MQMQMIQLTFQNMNMSNEPEAIKLYKHITFTNLTFSDPLNTYSFFSYLIDKLDNCLSL